MKEVEEDKTNINNIDNLLGVVTANSNRISEELRFIGGRSHKIVLDAIGQKTKKLGRQKSGERCPQL